MMPNRYNPVIIIKTIKRIDRIRGHLILSIALINGNITNASNTAIVNGKITEDAIFRTAAATITQIKIIIITIALRALKGLLRLFMPQSMP